MIADLTCLSPRSRPAEYRVGDTEYLRMHFNVHGTNGKGVVQLEMKKNKVRRGGEGKHLELSLTHPHPHLAGDG